MKDYNILKKWRKEAIALIRLRYPEASKGDIDKYLDKVIKKNLKDEEIKFNNSYTKECFSSSILDISEYCHKYKPIPTEHGCLFHPTKMNPAGIVLNTMADDRKKFKKIMYNYPKGSYMYNLYDLKQLLKKIEMNSYYGVSGAKTSIFYNLDIALSITGKGQTLISIATVAFEMFLANSVLFRSMNECLVFIKNVVSEKKKRNFVDSDYLDNNVTVEMVYDKLYKTFENKEDCNRGMIYSILSNLSKEDRNRIYYKNNLYAFFENKNTSKILKCLFEKIDTFTDPNKVPKEIEGDLKFIYTLLREYVLYNHQIIDRGYRLKTQKRKAVVVIDTDSNMINMNPWYEFVMDNVLSKQHIDSKNGTELRLSIIFSLVYLCSRMIADVLEKFLADCNVPEEKQDKLIMKNEYLYSRMLISNGKKNYAARMEFKEGNPVDDNKSLDIKGLALNKSVTNKHASKYFKEILENDILKSEKIDVSKILTKLNVFENEVRLSLVKGERKYLKPVSVKDFASYENPFSEQSVVSAMIWNMCYPDNEIVPPDRFDVIKMILNENQLEKLKGIDIDIYEVLKENVFSDDGKKNFKKGVTCIGIPQNVDTIPDWIVPFINTSTIIDDTMSSIIPVLKVLDLQILKDSHNNTYSNIIGF